MIGQCFIFKQASLYCQLFDQNGISGKADVYLSMDQVEVFKALSNKTRLQILKWLKDPEQYFPEQERCVKDFGVCVGEIQRKVNLTQSTVSEYLSLLQRTGLIEATRIGQWTYYRRNESAFLEFKEVIDKEL